MLVAVLCVSATAMQPFDGTSMALCGLELAAGAALVVWMRDKALPWNAAHGWQWPALVAVSVRLAWVLWADVAPVSDFAEYCQLGRHLADSGTFGLAGPTAYRPVGLPALLAVFAWLGWSLPVAASVANAVFAALTVPALAQLGQQAGQRRAGMLAAWMWALWPSQIVGSALVATEPLFLALLVWAVVCAVAATQALRWHRWALAAGLLFGLATYVRAHALAVPLVWGALLLAGGRGQWPQVLRLAAVAGVTVLVLVPWGLRNQQALGAFVLTTTNGGVTLVYGNNPVATGGYVALPLPIPGDTELTRNRNGYALATQWIAAHPLQAIALVPHKWQALLALQTDEASWALRSPRLVPLRPVAMGLSQLAWVVAKLLAFVAVWRRRAVLVPAAATAWAAVLATWLLIHTAFHGQYRYNAPLLPFVLLLAAVALVKSERSALPHRSTPPT